MSNEHDAYIALVTGAHERAEWARVLARPANYTPRVARANRSLIARLLGL